MSELTLIQQQRELLGTFRHAAVQLTKAEADAKAQLEREQEIAEIELKQLREQADEELSKIQGMLTKVQDWLKEGNWDQIIHKAKTGSVPSQASKTPVTGMSNCILLADKAFGSLKSWLIHEVEGEIKVKENSSDMLFLLFLFGAPLLASAFFYVAISPFWSASIFILGYYCVYYILNNNKLIDKYVRHYEHLIQSATDAKYWHRRWIEQMQETSQRRISDAAAHYEQTKVGLIQALSAEREKIKPDILRFTKQVNTLSPAWAAPTWHTWQPPRTTSTITRLGQWEVGKQQEKLSMPAILSLPSGDSSLLFKVNGAASSSVTNAIQSLLLRLLASIPPGKLRLTFIDPVGLGQNVAAFMHLAD